MSAAATLPSPARDPTGLTGPGVSGQLGARSQGPYGLSAVDLRTLG